MSGANGTADNGTQKRILNARESIFLGNWLLGNDDALAEADASADEAIEMATKSLGFEFNRNNLNHLRKQLKVRWKPRRSEYGTREASRPPSSGGNDGMFAAALVQCMTLMDLVPEKKLEDLASTYRQECLAGTEG